MKLLGISTDDLQNPAMARAFVIRLTTLLVGFALAAIVGYWFATEQRFYLMCFGGMFVVILVVFGMQRKAWILIPLTFLLTGGTSKLPIPFSAHDLGILLATTSYVAYRVLSQEHPHLKPHPLDLLVGINVIYLGLNLFKNPVGFAIFGSSSVGGRSLVNICIALMGYWVMVRLPNNIIQVSRIPYYILISSAIVSALSLLVFVVPSLSPLVTSWYAGVDVSAYIAELHGGSTGVVRLKGMSFFGLQLAMLLCAYYSPATLFDPRRGRFYAMLLAIVCVLVAGFRSNILWVMAAVGIGGWLYRRGRELAIAIFFGTMLLLLLTFGQGRLYDLPEGVQRSIAFLPGNWSSTVVKDAEESSTFRFKLWHDVIEWGLIKDWWFGDGFGTDLQDFVATWQGGHGEIGDLIKLTGSLHSGPLTSIRYVGICGLVLLYLLSISAAFYSYRCVNECRGSPLFPVAIYFAIQLIWGPIHYTLVFGAYEVYLPDLLFQIACLRLLFRLSGELKQNAAAKKVRIAPSAQSIATVPA